MVPLTKLSHSLSLPSRSWQRPQGPGHGARFTIHELLSTTLAALNAPNAPKEKALALSSFFSCTDDAQRPSDWPSTTATMCQSLKPESSGPHSTVAPNREGSFSSHTFQASGQQGLSELPPCTKVSWGLPVREGQRDAEEGTGQTTTKRSKKQDNVTGYTGPDTVTRPAKVSPRRQRLRRPCKGHGVSRPELTWGGRPGPTPTRSWGISF